MGLDHPTEAELAEVLGDGGRGMPVSSVSSDASRGASASAASRRNRVGSAISAAYAEPAVAALLARREGWRRDQLSALLGRAAPAPRDDSALLDLLVAVTSVSSGGQRCRSVRRT